MEVIDKANWNEENRKPTWIEFKECSYLGESEIFTIDELHSAVEGSYTSEDERAQRLADGNPSFMEWVLSSVQNKMKPEYKVEIDDNRLMYRIIKEI
jgi:hypothetical protein